MVKLGPAVLSYDASKTRTRVFFSCNKLRYAVYYPHYARINVGTHSDNVLTSRCIGPRLWSRFIASKDPHMFWTTHITSLGQTQKRFFRIEKELNASFK